MQDLLYWGRGKKNSSLSCLGLPSGACYGLFFRQDNVDGLFHSHPFPASESLKKNQTKPKHLDTCFEVQIAAFAVMW